MVPASQRVRRVLLECEVEGGGMTWRQYLAAGWLNTRHYSLSGVVHMPLGNCERMFRSVCLCDPRCDETDL